MKKQILASAQQSIAEPFTGIGTRHFSIAVLSSFPPRKCGIASFTKDFCVHLKNSSVHKPLIKRIACDNDIEDYSYHSPIDYQIHMHNIKDYQRAAQYVNDYSFDAVFLQHEFGLFGGRFGSYILRFAKSCKVPIIVVLHSVLQSPHYEQRRIIQELSQCAGKVIVMNPRAVKMLQDIYYVNPEKIAMVHHGGPNLSEILPEKAKEKLGVSGYRLLLSFGLLGPGKGFEYVIDSLPSLIHQNQNLRYYILGQVHPHILRKRGDQYLQLLKQRIVKNGVDSYVSIIDKYQDEDTLHTYLQAADILVAPYLCQEQIVSGTLAYAMTAGKAIIATPTWYAQEMLAEDRGILIPFQDSRALAQAIMELLGNEDLRNEICKRVYAFSRSMTWPVVAQHYQCVLVEVVDAAKKEQQHQEQISKYSSFMCSLPEVKLCHLRRLTDDRGLVQHAKYDNPDKSSGYCLDDTSRALIMLITYYHLWRDEKVVNLIYQYFHFLQKAFNPKHGMFRNMMNISGTWHDEIGSEDSQGHALWSLGALIERAPNLNIFCDAKELFCKIFQKTEFFLHPRPKAFAILGLCHYLSIFPEDIAAIDTLKYLTMSLHQQYKQHAQKGWMWFEPEVTYGNARLPHALFLGGRLLRNNDIQNNALSALKWLLKIQSQDTNHISLIGNKGWFCKDGTRANFDQQPIDAMALVQACADVYRHTRALHWLEWTHQCFKWFTGENDVGLIMYNPQTGGGYDGLEENSRNENQGAESTIAWLVSLVEMYELYEHAVLEEE